MGGAGQYPAQEYRHGDAHLVSLPTYELVTSKRSCPNSRLMICRAARTAVRSWLSVFSERGKTGAGDPTSSLYRSHANAARSSWGPLIPWSFIIGRLGFISWRRKWT